MELEMEVGPESTPETKRMAAVTKTEPQGSCKSETTGNRSTEDQCLVCFAKIGRSVNDCPNSPLNQLQDFLKVFQISLLSLEHFYMQDLPLRLFCTDCADRVLDAVQLLFRIECLQNDFNAVKKILRRDLIGSWVRTCANGTAVINGLRKTLVQCFSSCEVVLKPATIEDQSRNLSLPARVSPQNNYPAAMESDFQAMDDDFLELLSPVTILRRDFFPGEGLHERGCTTSEESDDSNNERGFVVEDDIVVYDDDYQAGGTEDGDDVDEDYRPGVGIAKRSKRVKPGPRSRKRSHAFRYQNSDQGLCPQDLLPLHTENTLRHEEVSKETNRSEEPSAYRVFMDGKLVGYNCSFCERKLDREDFLMDTGGYVFKCFDDCCGKSMDNFFNLVAHHEAFCPLKPAELYSITRKNKTRSMKLSKSKPSDSSEDIIRVSNGFKYDDSNAVIGFECPRCKKEMSRLDFLTESGEYVYKCEWDSCDKITTTLSNLAYHHSTHCSNRRRRRRVKYPKKVKRRQGNDEGKDDGFDPDNPDHNPEVDDKSSVLKKIRADLQMSRRKRGRPKKVFPFNCQKCGKGFLSERVLSLHEANHDKLSKPEGVVKPRDILLSTNRVYDDGGKLISFDCKFCQKKLSEKDYLTESGEYLFKCFPDCCDKVTGKFLNLVYHHEAFCPSKPSELYSNKRKYRRNTRQRREGRAEKRSRLEQSSLDITNSEAVDPTLVNTFHDQEGKLCAYRCPYCETKMCRDDYYCAEKDGYIFKCSTERCEKITDNFSNLASHHKCCCPMAPPKPKRIRKQRTAEKMGASIPPARTGSRVYDANSKLIGFECSFCQRSMLRETYATEPGNYVFKCFPDCCDKIMDHFSNLVSHHEAYCKLKPEDLYSKTRKLSTVSKPKDPNSEDTTEVEKINLPTPSTSTVKAGRRIYDDNNKLVRFECPFCERNITKEGFYSAEVGDYIFKCFPECCDKTTDNFPNLVYHHEAFCPSKPFELQSKKTHRRLKERSKAGSNQIISVNKGFKYDRSHVVISFECPRCQKFMTPPDFQSESGKSIFKCDWDLCDKITTTFANLAYHHEAHCSDRRLKPKWKPPKKSKQPPSQDEPAAESKPKIERQKDLDPVYCDQCGKAFKKRYDLARHMITHSDERPFACDQCPYTCKRNKSLKVHMRLHNDERPFLCPTCGKTFRSSSALNHHDKTHGTSTLPCSFCSRVFKSQPDLDLHMTRSHCQESGNFSDEPPGTSTSMQRSQHNPCAGELDLGHLWHPMF